MIYYSLPQNIRLRHKICVTDGVYLRWLSPLGNWEGWHFAGTNEDTNNVEEPASYRPGNGRHTVALRRPGIRAQVLRAGNLTADEHEALGTLLDSPQVYRQYPDGRREPLYVRSTSTPARTSAGSRFVFEVEVEQERRNTIIR